MFQQTAKQSALEKSFPFHVGSRSKRQALCPSNSDFEILSINIQGAEDGPSVDATNVTGFFEIETPGHQHAVTASGAW